jgi:hypothetical protein
MVFTLPADVDQRPVVIDGAGTLGRRIASVYAASGSDVRIFDLSAEQRQAARDYVEVHLAQTQQTLGLHPARRGRVEVSDDLQQAVAGGWMVIEAVPEKIDIKTPCARSSAAATCARCQKAPTTCRCGRLSVLAKRSLLNPPGNKPNTRVREPDLISHRGGDVQVSSVDVRPAVDHRNVVGTPSLVAHRKLGSKRQGTVRRTPRRRRHHLPRGRVGSWHRVPRCIPRLGFCLVGG